MSKDLFYIKKKKLGSFVYGDFFFHCHCSVQDCTEDEGRSVPFIYFYLNKYFFMKNLFKALKKKKHILKLRKL